MAKDGDRPVYRVLETRTIGWILVIVLVVGVSAAVLLILAYSGGDPRNSLEAIKTAGTIVIGSGGAVALWLAARRQRTTEIALKQKDLELEQKDREQAHAIRDGIERRVTELYTMAASQLDSDRAQTRLAAMYALERLANDNEGQRQSIVNLLCAYLRMVDAQPREHEWQVRQTVQRILATHLRPGSTFWPDIDLDLTGAELADFDLSGCRLRSASFAKVRFLGRTSISGAVFDGGVSFDEAVFEGECRLIGTRFMSSVDLQRVVFRDQVDCGSAHFHQHVRFNYAEFAGIAQFSGAVFTGSVQFGTFKGDGARFGRLASFRATRFAGHTVFAAVQFMDQAIFDDSKHESFTAFNDAVFHDSALFHEAEFLAGVRFRQVEFRGNVIFHKALLRAEVDFSGALFGAEAWLGNALLEGELGCWGARVRVDVGKTHRLWPASWRVSSSKVEELPDREGSWAELFDGALFGAAKQGDE